MFSTIKESHQWQKIKKPSHGRHILPRHQQTPTHQVTTLTICQIYHQILSSNQKKKSLMDS